MSQKQAAFYKTTKCIRFQHDDFFIYLLNSCTKLCRSLKYTDMESHQLDIFFQVRTKVTFFTTVLISVQGLLISFQNNNIYRASKLNIRIVYQFLLFTVLNEWLVNRSPAVFKCHQDTSDILMLRWQVHFHCTQHCYAYIFTNFMWLSVVVFDF